MPSSKNAEEILEDIIEEISNNSQECQWYIDLHRLSELMGISKEDFFRKLYAFQLKHKKNETREFRSGFVESDGEYLASFLNYTLGLDNTLEKFAESGIYFHQGKLNQLKHFCKNIIQTSLLKHELDKETLLILATATVDYDDAVDSYIQEKFELNFFIHRAVDEFMDYFKINPNAGAELFLYKYLSSLFPKKLNLREITREFRERSYYELFGKFRENPTKPKNSKKSELKELMEYFGLKDGFTNDELKKNFKTLLKKYHPDINKNGLKKTQEIISKYNKLLLIIQKK